METSLIIGKLVDMCFDKALHLVLISFHIQAQSLLVQISILKVFHIIIQSSTLFHMKLPCLRQLYSYVLINSCFNNNYSQTSTCTFYCTIKRQYFTSTFFFITMSNTPQTLTTCIFLNGILQRSVSRDVVKNALSSS